MKELVLAALQQTFRPEFLNRVDETVIFHALGREQIRAIVDIQIGYLMKRLADRKVTLELTEPAKDLLAEVGWDPSLGARPLKRAIQRYIFDPLAKGILAGQFGDGDTVLVDYPKGAEGLVFTRSAGPPPTAETVPPRGKKKHAKGDVIEPEVVE